MDWEALAKFFAGVVSLSGALAYIGKKVVDAFLQSRIEKHKSELQRITVEHSIRFQKLHAERAEVLKELYEKLVALDLSLHSTLQRYQSAGEPSLDDKVKDFGEKHNALFHFYLPKKIFFETRVCELLDEMLEKSKGVFSDITTYPVNVQDLNYRTDQELFDERQKFWKRAREVYQSEIAELRVALEKEFRAILGINV